MPVMRTKAKAGKAKRGLKALTLVLGATNLAPRALALTGDLVGDVTPLSAIPRQGHGLEESPFTLGHGAEQLAHSLGLYQQGQVGLDEAVTNLLRYEDNLSPYIEIRSVATKQVFAVQGLGESREYQFYLGGVRLCGFSVRAHAFGDGTPLVLGRVPDVTATEAPALSEWPDLEQTVANVGASLGPSYTNASVQASERCLYNSTQGLVPAWDLNLSYGVTAFHAVADEDNVYRREERFFAVDGTTSVYDNNPNDNQTVNEALHDLVGDGTLTSTRFFTNPGSQPRAQVSDEQFVFPTTDARFAEANVFYHVTRMADWFQSLGFQFQGPKVELRLHALLNNTPNNALYQPADATADGNPTIFVGDGDGKILQNLDYDSDVVSHELGHHIVYTTLKSTQGESLVIHEGLADFFAFSRSGDACLGESICPNGSPACFVPNKCLRTAQNTLSLTDPDLPQEAHLRSQFLSGMLWDLRTKYNMAADDVTRLVFKGVDYLQAESQYRDLVIALMASDRALNAGAYCSKILDDAAARGLSSDISGLVCPLPANYPALQGDPTTTTTTATNNNHHSSHSGWCGVVGENERGGAPWLTFLTLALPLAFTRRRRRSV